MDIWLGVLLGVAYVVPPGPVNIETVRRGLTGGLVTALAIQLGAVVVDIVYAMLAMVGIRFLLTHSIAQLTLGLMGTALLGYLGWSALQNGPGLGALLPRLAGETIPRTQAPPTSVQRSFWIGVAISIANPYSIAFWLSVGGTLMQNSHHHGLVFLCGFILGSLASSLLIACLVGYWCLRITPRLLRLTSSACGLALFAFALSLGYSVVLAWSR
jgi:threonine/homoserine/homoserine lactone efflux protein